MLDTLLEHLLSEWRVIKEATLSFIVSVTFASVLIFFAVDWHYSGEIGMRDATIKWQDERLTDYRTKLNGASPNEAASQISAMKTHLDNLQQYKERHEAEEWPALNTEQQQEWVTELSRYSGRLQQIEIVSRDSREEVFVDSLVKVFKAANLPEPTIGEGGI